jgi:hypothetical protein
MAERGDSSRIEKLFETQCYRPYRILLKARLNEYGDEVKIKYICEKIS